MPAACVQCGTSERARRTQRGTRHAAVPAPRHRLLPAGERGRATDASTYCHCFFFYIDLLLYDIDFLLYMDISNVIFFIRIAYINWVEIFAFYGDMSFSTMAFSVILYFNDPN